MKTKLSIALFIIISLKSFSQVNYEKGYFIDLNGKRTECLIKNQGWKNNPTGFEYKLAEGDVSNKMNVSSVKEFGITAQSRYLAADVKIDRTGDDYPDLSMNKNPVWLNERLFLEVLIESKTSLLSYNSKNLRRFFYEVDDTIKQLVFKKYLNEKNEVVENNAFQQQLWVNVRCGDVTESTIKQLSYTKAELAKYFKNYLECSGSELVDHAKTGKKGGFHMKLTPGINFSSLILYYSENTRYKNSDVDYGSQTDFRMGLEGEFVLPYNKNKWSVVLEPNYQTFSSTNKDGTKLAKYNSFEIPLGVRYYMFLTKKSRVFVNGLFVYSIPSESSYIQALSSDLPVSQTGSFAIGAGFAFGKFSSEIRYYKNGDILDDYLKWTAPYTKLSFILGYRLF